MHFKVVGAEKLRTVIATKGSSTAFAAGMTVAVSSGLIVKGAAASTKLAYAPFALVNGETQAIITEGNDFILEGTGDAVYAQDYAGKDVDQVDDTNQYIDVGTASTLVFTIDASENAGTVGSASGIRVRINKPIF